MSQPPPPPPHGEAPKSSGLGPGNYDIFVIPQREKGGGFIYLPSLQPNVNSFAAGFASALVLVAFFQSMAPAFQAWWNSFQGMGSMGMTMLVVAVGVGAWAWGRSQIDAAAAGMGGTTAGGQHGPGGFGGTGPGTHSGTTPNTGPPPPPPPHNSGPPPNTTPGNDRPKQSWQRPPPQPGTTRAETPKGAWEKAREETRRKEEERKAKEEEERRKAATAQRLKELREKEAREREQREKEAKDRRDRLEREIREKEELKQKLEKERQEREKLEKEKAEREREERRKKEAEEAAAREVRKGSTYAYSRVGEKTNPWPNGKPPIPSPSSSPTKPASSTASSPNKRPPPPTARTYLGTDEEAYSYRPYDQPKRPTHNKAPSSVASDFSWAPSQSTSHTTPPPSMRGPYTTKDPDKIVIKAVYLFMNQFAKTPASQLVSGIGSVTDGLILRVTTEGLFIDDDVRGVPQREWDVKAWTLKLVEVWCPQHCLNCNSASPLASNSANHPPNLFAKMASQRARAADRGATKTLTGDEADALLTETLRACKNCCRLGLCPSTLNITNTPSSNGQNGEWKTKGLHVLRATIRDQEAKRYMFVLDQEESWKVAAGLQRLRKGTQVRALGVSSMSASEAKNTLEFLGWG